MGLRSALAVAFAIGLWMGPAHADPYRLLQSCIAASDAACIENIGSQLAGKIADPRKKALMIERFGLIDWASGNRIEGNTRLLAAWSQLEALPNKGCIPRIDATFAFEDLTAQFNNQLASRLVLRNLVKEASGWPKDASVRCARPEDQPHWLLHVAARQHDLGDAYGLSSTLDLAQTWALDPKMATVSYASRPRDVAKLLATYGRAGDAIKLCDTNRARIRTGLGSSASAQDKVDAEWNALECYRAGGLKDLSRTAYKDFAQARLDALGLGDPNRPAPAGTDSDAYGLALWDLAQAVGWHDPIFFDPPANGSVVAPRECFLHPSAQCLAVGVMNFVDTEKRGAGRRIGNETIPDFRSAGALDGVARFLVGAERDVVGDLARTWFLDQAQQAPLENLRAIVGDAARAGDLIWARRIFYSWYQSGGESYFRHLAAPNASDMRGIDEDAWPLHVAWSIALIVDQLSPAFEPEELSNFAQTAWDDGITQMPSLHDIPPTELIDTDERSGEHLLNLCFRDAFGEWAARLFAHAHLPDRARQARDLLPGAARDCAFAKRSIGPILRTAEWFAEEGDRAQTRSLLLEGADRLTRPHYHVYDDSDPALGGAALAAMALGIQKGVSDRPALRQRVLSPIPRRRFPKSQTNRMRKTTPAARALTSRDRLR